MIVTMMVWRKYGERKKIEVLVIIVKLLEWESREMYVYEIVYLQTWCWEANNSINLVELGRYEERVSATRYGNKILEREGREKCVSGHIV